MGWVWCMEKENQNEIMQPSNVARGMGSLLMISQTQISHMRSRDLLSNDRLSCIHLLYWEGQFDKDG